MKVNEIKEEFLVNYLKLDDADEEDIQELKTWFSAAKEYIMNQTGITEEELNRHDDLTTAVLVLTQDMHDNRRYYVDNSNVNHVVKSIIYQYSENLL